MISLGKLSIADVRISYTAKNSQNTKSNLLIIMQRTPEGYPLPKTILLASGGARGICYIGALQLLEKKGCLANVKTWAGVSVGALTATCAAIGYTINEISEITLRFNFGSLKNINELGPLRLLETYGLESGDALRRFINALFHIKGYSHDMKFKELPTGHDLKLWVTNLTKGKLELYSRATTPDAQIAVALRASACIPVVYDPVMNDEGDILVDGAVIDAFPILYMSEKERKEMIGIRATYPFGNRKITSFFNYIQKCVLLGFESRNTSAIHIYKNQIICIELGHISPADFDISLEVKEAAVQLGEDYTHDFLQAYRQQKPARRYSI